MKSRTRPGLFSQEWTKSFLKPIARQLKTGNSAATIDRLFDSQHVRDLQLIMAAAFLGVLLVLVIGLPLAWMNEVVNNWHEISSRTTDWVLVRFGLAALRDFVVFFGPVLAAFAGLLTWIYQVGSARLGVVDLFACEISTVCRVAAVADVVQRLIKKFEDSTSGGNNGAGGAHAPAQDSGSQESYFPVFESCIKDLQSLEARVVIDITAFYTYMKAVRDARRSLAAAAATRGGTQPFCDLIYMLFLGLESARHAIRNLVEFEPEQAERTIVILFNELEAYHFLMAQFPDPDNPYRKSLMLRVKDYEYLVPLLLRTVRTGRTEPYTPAAASPWERARQLLKELEKRYEDAAIDQLAAVNQAKN